jgi:hypothetical protein
MYRDVPVSGICPHVAHATFIRSGSCISSAWLGRDSTGVQHREHYEVDEVVILLTFSSKDVRAVQLLATSGRPCYVSFESVRCLLPIPRCTCHRVG